MAKIVVHKSSVRKPTIVDFFTDKTNTNNLQELICEELPNEIFINTPIEHTFELHFDITDYIEEIQVIYSQGLNQILKKDITIQDITIANNHTFVRCNLSAEDTSLFKKNYLDILVQLKLTTENQEEIIYDIPHKLLVLSAIGVYNKNLLEG